ncbi:hypothetical protein N7510_000717 [Penicillium lagena]|uniref:uncharacterized protein n=1 Tax=Penicillium lagena TaxID=94218 RepID=UPI00254191B2|nr:uncharacterized protein N7510_000717 [Penicillium lagena]KAJ5624408.1 hypothetical protein N7510_000717 [Penicillium lagena]
MANAEEDYLLIRSIGAAWSWHHGILLSRAASPSTSVIPTVFTHPPTITLTVVRPFMILSSTANTLWWNSGVRRREQSRAKGIPTWSFHRARCVDGSFHAGGRTKQRREVLVSMTGSNVCTNKTTMIIAVIQQGRR